MRYRELFDYDADGYLRWKVSRSNRIKIGDKAGSLDPRGYSRVWVDGKQQYIHRVVWAWHYGELPNLIDHIDQDKTNNRIENLRPLTKGGNILNSNSVRGKVSKRGVWLTRHGTYSVSFRSQHIGTFKTAEEASSIYEVARIKYFKVIN